jgi:GTPase SAR1 family protein
MIRLAAHGYDLCSSMFPLKVPVIVVGCKLDLRDDQQNSLEQTMAPMMQFFREIKTCIEYSALCHIQVKNTPFGPPNVYSLKFVLLPHLICSK